MLRKALLTTAVCILAAPASSADELELGVMTFNIRFGIAHDRENNWSNRQDMVVNMLKDYDPDIIGTQELLPFQADYITRWIPEYRWFGSPRGEGSLPERSAIFYKWPDIIAIETGTFWLSETPEIYGSSSWGSSVARVATWGRFHHRETRTDFYVYNTHFDHVSQEARVNGMQVILEHIAENAGEHPVIFVGDFNARAEKNEVYDMAVAKFDDAWLTAEEQKGPAATWNAFSPVPEDSDRRIDWILTRGPFEVDSIETITYNVDGRFVSDHFPVYARMRLELEEEESESAPE